MKRGIRTHIAACIMEASRSGVVVRWSARRGTLNLEGEETVPPGASLFGYTFDELYAKAMNKDASVEVTEENFLEGGNE